MKPGNVLVTENFDAKIADFGIAISGGGRITSNDQFEGTLFYMSPEVRLSLRMALISTLPARL